VTRAAPKDAAVKGEGEGDSEAETRTPRGLHETENSCLHDRAAHSWSPLRSYRRLHLFPISPQHGNVVEGASY